MALADPNEQGLSDARKRLKAELGFADYGEMLESVRPDIVAVCRRHPDQHRDMVVRSIEAGAKGVYVEKPFCRTPGEADEIIAAAEKHQAKVAIAHRNRYHPSSCGMNPNDIDFAKICW